MNNQDFERYWKTFSNSLQSYIIRESKISTLHVDEINKEKDLLVSKWFQSQTAEGVWYKELFNSDRQKAEDFRTTFCNFTLKQEEIRKPNIIWYYFSASLVGILCIILSIIIFDGWKAFFAALLGIMLAFSFIIPWGSKRIEDANNYEMKLYMAQINELYKSIINILKY